MALPEIHVPVPRVTYPAPYPTELSHTPCGWVVFAISVMCAETGLTAPTDTPLLNTQVSRRGEKKKVSTMLHLTKSGERKQTHRTRPRICSNCTVNSPGGAAAAPPPPPPPSGKFQITLKGLVTWF